MDTSKVGHFSIKRHRRVGLSRNIESLVEPNAAADRGGENAGRSGQTVVRNISLEKRELEGAGTSGKNTPGESERAASTSTRIEGFRLGCLRRSRLGNRGTILQTVRPERRTDDPLKMCAAHIWLPGPTVSNEPSEANRAFSEAKRCLCLVWLTKRDRDSLAARTWRFASFGICERVILQIRPLLR